MLVEFEPAAKPHFDHRPFALRLGENAEGGGGQEVEPGGAGAGRLSFSRGLVSVERLIEGACERSLVNLASLEAHPFGQPLDMGRGVASDPKAGAHERNLDQRGDRSLALGSGDMN